MLSWLSVELVKSLAVANYGEKLSEGGVYIPKRGILVPGMPGL